jgi:hypothetical protein
MKMPDESCRKCGGLLLEYTVCAKCREVTRFVCRICGFKTMERFHDGLCFRPKSELHPLVAEIKKLQKLDKRYNFR